jgi:TRAP transporter TAXI family solute receptor
VGLLRSENRSVNFLFSEIPLVLFFRAAIFMQEFNSKLEKKGGTEMKNKLNRLAGLFSVGIATICILLTGYSDAQEKKIQILLAAPPTTWRAYTRAVVTSDLVNRATNLDITVRAYSGNSSVITAVSMGEASFGLGPGDSSVSQAYGGFGEFKGKPPARSLRMVLNSLLYRASFLATPSSGIRTIPGLKGKKVAWFLAEPNDLLESILGAYGIDLEKDVVAVRVQDSPKALVEMSMGRIDACVTNVDLTPGLIAYIEAKGHLVLLPIDLEMFILAKRKYPEKMTGILPLILQPGSREFLEMKEPMYVSIQPCETISRGDVSADIVYTYVKCWLDNINKIKELGTGLAEFGPEVIQVPSAVPYHEGAIKALKEKKFWTKEMEEGHQTALKR